MNKKNFILLLVVLVPLYSSAQKPKVKNDPSHDEKPLHFGFSLGLNWMDFRIQHSDLARQDSVYVSLKEVKPGINIYAIANLRLADNFDLRTLPGISFGDRNIYYNYPNSGKEIIKVPSSYLELPFCLKYKSKRLNNFRPYLIGGYNFRWNIAGNREYDIEKQKLIFSIFDSFGEIGYGMDFYLTYFKFAVELKYSFGTRNVFEKTDKHGEKPPTEIQKYTNAIDKITAHSVILLFHFE